MNIHENRYSKGGLWALRKAAAALRHRLVYIWRTDSLPQPSLPTLNHGLYPFIILRAGPHASRSAQSPPQISGQQGRHLSCPYPPNSKSAVQPLASSTVTPADNSTVSPSDAHPGLLLEWMEDQQQRFHNYLQHKPPGVHALEHRRLISLYNQLAQQLIIRFPAHQLPSVHLLLQSFKLIIEASNALMAQSTHCTDSTEVGPETPLLPLV